MSKTKTSFYTNLLTSGHSFENNEVLLKFQYQVLNTVLMVMALFTFIFATLSILDINPLGIIQTIANYLLVIISALLMFRLRGDKARYLQTAYFMYASAFTAFISALMFVPHDEFRIIWFYLLVFAAYITGGVRAGNTVSLISIFAIIIINLFYELQLSSTAIISAVLGLMIASLFFRAYTKKITDFEKDIIEQEHFLITQSRFAAMGEMMSMIAHQWRQPLSTTTMMITNERIKSVIEGREPNEYDKILDNISDTMVYLSDTIDDFQTYFKPEKSTQEIEVRVLIERVVQFIEHRLKIAKVELHVGECGHESIEIYANEVVQVLLNIINNAIDILEERAIEDRHIWITVNSTDKNLTISIEDNGGGVNKEIIERIFEPYFSSKSKNGTGLGLYMSKMIIDNHINGVLGVTNTKKGALFSVLMPKT